MQFLKQTLFKSINLGQNPTKLSFNFDCKTIQAGAELGQAQIKLELGFTLIKI